MKSPKLALFLFFVLLNAAFSENTKTVDITIDAKIPMRDGDTLSANIYKPADMDGPLPALFVLTPYGCDRVHKDGKYFAENGYVVVAADCRGRGNSGGGFVPFVNEGRDAYDAIKWISEQSWCSGKVGMFGGSYLGMVQWLALKENPPALYSVIPTAAVCPGIDFPKFMNIYYTYNMQWLTFVHGSSVYTNTFIDHEYWNAIFEKLFIEHVPYYLLDQISGLGENKIFKTWLEHPYFDEYYESILPSQEEYARMNAAVLTVTGHFDDDQPGNLYYYDNFMKYGKPDVTEQCHIIIGPWNHGGTRHPSNRMGNLEFADNAVIDMNNIHLQWFDHTLKDAEKPEFLENKAAVYEMGSDKWLYAESLDALEPKTKEFYLSSPDSKADDVFHSGQLTDKKPGAEDPDKYIYDPVDTTNAASKIQNKLIDFSWREEDEAFYPDKLIYHSPPLAENLRIAGRAEMFAHISMNVADTDFEAILYEIRPDGKCIYLTSAIMRAKHRNTLRKAELVEPGKIYEYEIDTFHYFAREINKGSRLRLVFGCLNSPYYQKNYNGGMDATFETLKAAKTAEVKLHLGEKTPSKLVLPIATK